MALRTCSRHGCKKPLPKRNRVYCSKECRSLGRGKPPGVADDIVNTTAQYLGDLSVIDNPLAHSAILLAEMLATGDHSAEALVKIAQELRMTVKQLEITSGTVKDTVSDTAQSVRDAVKVIDQSV